MRLIRTVFTALLACNSILAHPSPDSSLLQERQNYDQIVITTGPHGSGIFPRLEIRDLKDNYPRQWTLFVLALQRWQAQSQDDATSYFGVSSIHGVPAIAYNGIGQCAQCQNSEGHCPHDSVLFPSWHRVYVALFEQEFLKIVKAVANEYPAGQQRNDMVNVANQMRWPHWDWAAAPPPGRPHYPWLVSDSTFTVNGPKGQVTIDNPLFRYNFQNSGGMKYYPFTTWNRSFRWPTGNDNNAISNNDAARSAFNNIAASIKDQVYSLFVNCHDYLHFSNDDAGSSSAGCALSLESIHNTIHNTGGGPTQNSVSGGHLTYLSTSSYDPLFWLLHGNVDRLFAMWQTLNPNSYGASQVASHSTWTIAQGSTQGPDSPLVPFYKNNNGDFWTTNDVRDWKVFKYTYNEFLHSDGSKAAITNYVNGLYGPNSNKAAGSAKRSAQLDDMVDDLVNSTDSLLADAMPGNTLLAANGTAYQYYANVVSPRYTLNGSYQIYLFNGEPASEDPATWIVDSNLIGPIGVIAQPGMEHSDVTVTSQISLTRCLQDHVLSGLLSGLTEAIVAPFLTANLKWRVQGPEGNSIDPGSVEGFTVSIFTTTATQPESADELPVIGDLVPLLDVTKGQSGGANDTLVQYLDSSL